MYRSCDLDHLHKCVIGDLGVYNLDPVVLSGFFARRGDEGNLEALDGRGVGDGPVHTFEAITGDTPGEVTGLVTGDGAFCFVKYVFSTPSESDRPPTSISMRWSSCGVSLRLAFNLRITDELLTSMAPSSLFFFSNRLPLSIPPRRRVSAVKSGDSAPAAGDCTLDCDADFKSDTLTLRTSGADEGRFNRFLAQPPPVSMLRHGR
mmetsp:Transcript_31641/g.72694  ORF Transcript_31641/g.72694 Transcript_31641/m.72694 type:complete len:205 (+) Transcript_31641:612-1226(+)